MKYRLLSIFFLFPAYLFVSCLSTSSDSGALSASLLSMVQNAVFEVVVEKPAEGHITYDRELNWDNVPYSIRSDDYYSIGTAFAISRTELVTAFHVINLGYESIVYDKYFIRDSSGKVYEIDRIIGGSNEKDYLIFTVKGKTFDKYFQFEHNYKIGDPVFSIGNALGEGIIVRNGLVLGTVPEEDSGRWNLLKSSADGNPGNSGGPLVTPGGKVVALVTMRQDNIIYSLPADIILNDSRSALSYRSKMRFGHLILTNNLNVTFETTAALPNSYTVVRDEIRAAYKDNYDVSMTKLFEQAPEYLNGPNNAFLLDSSLSSHFPEISYVDSNDDNWKLSGLSRNARAYPLSDDGQLSHVQASGMNFYKIIRPKTVSLEKVNTDPQYIMDLILQNIRTERTLWGNDKYRILSFGLPSSTGRHQDSLGRIWITAQWRIEFADEICIMYILPMPDGPVIIITERDSSLIFDYEWDIRMLCDHVLAAYTITFEDWDEYLALSQYTPNYIKNMRFIWNSSERSFSLSYEDIRINSDKNVFDWADNSELFIAPTWYRQNDAAVFGFRKIILNRDPWGNDYIVLYRNILPDQKLGTRAMENWNNLASERYPFNGVPTVSARDNTGTIGAILNNKPSPNSLLSAYLSMENNLDEENLIQRFNAFRKSISISN